LLAESHGWFTEGFDTADVQEAKALLEDLSCASGVGWPGLKPWRCWLLDQHTWQCCGRMPLKDAFRLHTDAVFRRKIEE